MLPSPFRFLVICQNMSQRIDDGLVTLTDVVNHIDCSTTTELDLAAIVGIVLDDTMAGKRLGLEVSILVDRMQRRQPLPRCPGKWLNLPAQIGAQVLPYTVQLTTPRTGMYCVDLWDHEGVCGPSGVLLATYLFGVTVEPTTS